MSTEEDEAYNKEKLEYLKNPLHLNKELFGDYFYHGTTFRHGHIKRGDIIRPAEELGIEPNHPSRHFPESRNWVHATYRISDADIYARWTAQGDHEHARDDEKMGVSYKPHVFQVEPVGEMEVDPKDRKSVRAKGFKVVRRVLPNEVRPT